MKQQHQPYFIRPQNLSSRHTTNKISFFNKDDPQSNSQNIRRKTPILAQPLQSPQLLKDLYPNIIYRRHPTRVTKNIPTLNSPLHDGSISKYKIVNDLSVYKLPTTRRLKSDDQVISLVPSKKLKSQHINNIKLRIDRRKNYTPLIKMKTEPNDIPAQSVSKQDESQEILFRLHKQSIPTEPNDKLQSILGDKIVSSIKQIEKYSQDFIELDSDSQFFNELKETQKNRNSAALSQHTKERILDLLCLSTQELKRKFAEQQNKVGNSKITARQANKLVLPRTGKSKFPTDFFNALLPNSILQ